MKARSATQVIAKIACPYLKLHRGAGYWYFTFDDEINTVYDEFVVMTMYLNSMELDAWVIVGKSLVARAAKTLEDRV